MDGMNGAGVCMRELRFGSEHELEAKFWMRASDQAKLRRSFVEGASLAWSVASRFAFLVPTLSYQELWEEGHLIEVVSNCYPTVEHRQPRLALCGSW